MTESIEDQETADDGLTYDDVYEALGVVRDTLRDLGSKTRSHWQEIASVDSLAKGSLMGLLGVIKDHITSMYDALMGETSDEAPPIESDTADDVDDVADDTSSTTEEVVAVIDDDGIDHD